MSQRKNVKKLADVLKQCRIAEPDRVSPQGTVLHKLADPALIAKWPKLRVRVPPLFLHKPAEFKDHARALLERCIKFYQPYRGRYQTKIVCPTFSDHRSMAYYFNKNNLPYHTYGHPNKRKLKVIIRGLPNNIDLNVVKQELLNMSVPIIRVHKMHTKQSAKQPPLLVLVVVPYDDDGKKIFVVKKILGHDVKLEPPKQKLRQCYRCQKWGHCQRYCYGVLKCVKCAGDHYYKKCPRDASKEPPKCANCGKDHVASFRMCAHCPQSIAYGTAEAIMFSDREDHPSKPGEKQLVTLENIDNLYRSSKKKVRHFRIASEACEIDPEYDDNVFQVTVDEDGELIYTM